MDYRGVLHRDGSVLMSVSLDQLKVRLTSYILYFIFCHLLYLSFFFGKEGGGVELCFEIKESILTFSILYRHQSSCTSHLQQNLSWACRLRSIILHLTLFSIKDCITSKFTGIYISVVNSVDTGSCDS